MWHLLPPPILLSVLFLLSSCPVPLPLLPPSLLPVLCSLPRAPFRLPARQHESLRSDTTIRIATRTLRPSLSPTDMTRPFVLCHPLSRALIFLPLSICFGRLLIAQEWDEKNKTESHDKVQAQNDSAILMDARLRCCIAN